MNLVVGATGTLGTDICRRLAARGLPVRALVRRTSSPERVRPLADLGAEIVEGNLLDPASIRAACRGATSVVTTVSTTISRQPEDTLESVDHRGQEALVDAAAQANVSRFVYVSVSGNIPEDAPLTQAKRSVERRLAASGLSYTILRPTFFMEVWLGPHLGFDVAAGRVRIYGSGERPISFISFADVGEFAAQSLSSPSADRATLELGGPDAHSPLEVVRIAESITGRKFEVEHVPEAALQAQKAAATDPLAKTFASLMLGYADGDVIPMGETLKKFPVRLTSVREHLNRAAGKR